MAVKLQKPLGSDIYDVNVFNSNFAIIEEYINKYIATDLIDLKIYYYPETSESFNIDDNLPNGIHVCDGLLLTNLYGTYPAEDARYNFIVISMGKRKDGTSEAQMYFDMSRRSNRIYTRTSTAPYLDLGETVPQTWGAWFQIAGTGAGEEYFLTNYVNRNSYNLGINEINKSGIYFFKSITDSPGPSTFPIDSNGNPLQEDVPFLILNYGKKTDDNQFQMFISLSDAFYSYGKILTRVYYKQPDLSYTWSNWQPLAAGSGGDSGGGIVGGEINIKNIFKTYVTADNINIDEIKASGSYILDNTDRNPQITVTGTFPVGYSFEENGPCLLIHNGYDVSKIMTQTLLFVHEEASKNDSFSRRWVKNAEGNYGWSSWLDDNAGVITPEEKVVVKLVKYPEDTDEVIVTTV